MMLAVNKGWKIINMPCLRCLYDVKRAMTLPEVIVLDRIRAHACLQAKDTICIIYTKVYSHYYLRQVNALSLTVKKKVIVHSQCNPYQRVYHMS